jgi:thioredoxin
MMFWVTNCAAQSGGNNEGEVVMLNKADFLTKVFNYEKNAEDWVYEGTKPCIIDFYADWCGPCKIIAPIMKELAVNYKDDIIVYKIDIDQERELAAVFGITSIPLILFVPMEGPPQAALGALPKEVMEEQIKLILLGQE